MSKRKRRKFSAEFKAENVLSVLTGEKSQAAVQQLETSVSGKRRTGI